MGKSVFALHRAMRALLQGRVLATNVELVEGWEYEVASHYPGLRFRKAERDRVAEVLSTRYYYQPDVLELTRTFIRGHGEGRGHMLIDETQLNVSNRRWDDKTQQQVCDELTHVRKRGWTCDFIAQHADNTDVAIRRVAGEEIRCINWKKLLRMPLVGTDLLPRPLFLAIAYTLNAGQVKNAAKPNWRQLYRLGWQANMFDTFQEFVLAAYPPDQRVYLPSTPAERHAALARRRFADAGQAATAAGPQVAK